MMTIGPVNQSTTSGYVYATLFNPVTSLKNFILRKIGMQVDRSGAATNPAYTNVAIRKISSASGGTLVATTSIQKNTTTASSSAEVRSTNVTAVFQGSADSRLVTSVSPGVVNQIFGDYGSTITSGDELILKPGEGVALYQEQATGDVNVRYHFFLEWAESGSTTPAQSISFTVSTSSVFFGVLSSTQTMYASSTNTSGSNTEVEAHTLSVITNAPNGYTIIVQGPTLTSGSVVIPAIGGTNTLPSIGSEQFGIRMTASGGSGTTTSPYGGTGFAYGATATTSSQVASASVGDNATTTYSVRYMANIAGVTGAASYTTNLVYIATANF
jgi:hypothetical protein